MPSNLTPVSQPTTAPRPPWGVRLVLVVLSLAAWYGTQALIQSRPDPPEDEAHAAGVFLARYDGLLHVAAPLHDYLLEHRAWADWLLIASSAIVDVLGIFLLGRA